jgi:hypothetical protein
MAQEDRDTLATVVMELLKSKAEACPPGSASAQPGPRIACVPVPVLAKEAVYNAAGVGAYELYDYVDFSSWFQSTLLQVSTLPQVSRAWRP